MIEQHHKADKNGFLTDLAASYASLFLNVGPKPVFLVESVYRGKHHVLYEEPYFEIVEAYRLLGFEKSKSFLEPEDHIAVELEFMFRLSDLTGQNLESGNMDYAIRYINLQREFLEDHLTKWVPDLAEKLKEASDNKFYTALAHLTMGFVTADIDFVKYVYEDLKRYQDKS